MSEKARDKWYQQCLTNLIPLGSFLKCSILIATQFMQDL